MVTPSRLFKYQDSGAGGDPEPPRYLDTFQYPNIVSKLGSLLLFLFSPPDRACFLNTRYYIGVYHSAFSHCSSSR